MKFCRDCSHYVTKPYPPHNLCERNFSTDMVTGEKNLAVCAFERSVKERCGPEAKHFEPKKPPIIYITDEALGISKKKTLLSWLKSLFS